MTKRFRGYLLKKMIFCKIAVIQPDRGVTTAIQKSFACFFWSLFQAKAFPGDHFFGSISINFCLKPVRSQPLTLKRAVNPEFPTGYFSEKNCNES